MHAPGNEFQYFWHMCAKCMPLGCKFNVFLEHVFQIVPSGYGSYYVQYMCAKCTPICDEFVVFLEHMCQVQPLEQYFSNICAKCRLRIIY